MDFISSISFPNEPLISWTFLDHFCHHCWVGLLLLCCCTHPKVMTKMAKKCSTDQRLIRKRNTTYKIHTLVVSFISFGICQQDTFALIPEAVGRKGFKNIFYHTTYNITYLYCRFEYCFVKSSLKFFQTVFAGETLILGNEKVCLVNKIEEERMKIKELCPLKKQVDISLWLSVVIPCLLISKIEKLLIFPLLPKLKLGIELLAKGQKISKAIFLQSTKKIV